MSEAFRTRFIEDVCVFANRSYVAALITAILCAVVVDSIVLRRFRR